jgi:hypothetical protein
MLSSTYLLVVHACVLPVTCGSAGVSTFPMLLHVGVEGVLSPGRLYLEQRSRTPPSWC